MAGEYLTPQEAKEVKLPILNVFARRRKIQEYVGPLAAGFVSPEIVSKTRAGLVFLAQKRQTMDEVLSTRAERLQPLTELAEQATAIVTERNDSTKEDLRFMLIDVPDTSNQPGLFKGE